MTAVSHRGIGRLRAVTRGAAHPRQPLQPSTTRHTAAHQAAMLAALRLLPPSYIAPAVSKAPLTRRCLVRKAVRSSMAPPPHHSLPVLVEVVVCLDDVAVRMTRYQAGRLPPSCHWTLCVQEVEEEVAVLARLPASLYRLDGVTSSLPMQHLQWPHHPQGHTCRQRLHSIRTAQQGHIPYHQAHQYSQLPPITLPPAPHISQQWTRRYVSLLQPNKSPRPITIIHRHSRHHSHSLLHYTHQYSSHHPRL